MADPISPFTPTMQQQIEQLLQSQVDRSNNSTPIHQAAMAMASRMAPGYAQSAMTGPSPIAQRGGSITPSVSSPGGPGIGTTAMAALAAAFLKNPKLLALLKGLLPGGADPTFGGLIQGNKPPVGGTGFPDVPFGSGGGNTGDPTQPGGAQGQIGGIGLPFYSPYGGSGSPPIGSSGQQGSYTDDPSKQAV
jgi:hypothetical protein